MSDEGTSAAPVEAVEAPEANGSVPEGAGPGGKRRRGRTIVLWILAALALGAVAFGVVVGAQALNRARSAQANLDAAVKLLDAAEDDLLAVDSAVQAGITSEAATQAADALPLAQQVKADALAASALIDEALSDLSEELVPIAEALKASADARVEMMTEAPAILEADRKAALALEPADAAIAEIAAAEDLVAKAATEFNKHTSAGVKQSTTYSTQAEERLKNAQSLLTTASAAFAEADFTSFTAYVDAKLAVIADSKVIDKLWLDGKIEESNAKLAAYNTKNDQAVALAKELPESGRIPIADAYDALTKDATTKYFEARERARSAGERVKELREAQEAQG